MSFTLLVYYAPLSPPLGLRFEGKQARLGRGAEVELRLPDPTLSEVHASVKKRGTLLLLCDEGSPNGSWVQAAGTEQPVRLGPDAPRVLAPGDRVWLGQVELEFVTRGAPKGADLVADLRELQLELLRRSVEELGEDASEERLMSWLEELWRAPFERLSDEEESGGEERSPGGSRTVATEEKHLPLFRDPKALDRVLAGAAALVLLGFGFGLYWVFFVSPH